MNFEEVGNFEDHLGNSNAVFIAGRVQGTSYCNLHPLPIRVVLGSKMDFLG